MDAPDEGGEKPEKPSPTPLDAERAKLRAAGYTDHEISQILIAKAAAAPHATSGGLGVMSGALNNFTAALATARGAIPNMLTDVETVFGAGVARASRIKAFVAFTFKAVLIGAIGFAVYQEWRQHIISETEIAEVNARKAHYEECRARIDAVKDITSVEKWDDVFGPIEKDCNPEQFKARPSAHAECSAKFKAVLGNIDNASESPDAFLSRLEKHKADCKLTDDDRKLLSEKLDARSAACSAKLKTILANMENAPPTTNEALAKPIIEHKAVCGLSDDDKKLVKEKLDVIAAKSDAENKAKIASILQDHKQADSEREAGHYAEAFKLAQKYADRLEALEIERKGKAGNLTAGAQGNLSFYALLVREFEKALRAAELSIELKPDLVAETNHAHALMFLGRVDEARTLYLAHKGETVQGKTWEKAIEDDFAELRKAGITHPLMAEIEAVFDASASKIMAMPSTPHATAAKPAPP